MKYLGAILILCLLIGCDEGSPNAWAYGHGGGHFHAGSNRIHKRLHYRIHAQHTQSYVEGGIHVTP